jgi:hypothetical protein
MRADYLRAESSPREREKPSGAAQSLHNNTSLHGAPFKSHEEEKKRKKEEKKSSIKMAGHKRE